MNDLSTMEAQGRIAGLKSRYFRVSVIPSIVQTPHGWDYGTKREFWTEDTCDKVQNNAKRSQQYYDFNK